MTGVTKPVGALTVPVVLGSHAAKGMLPLTGVVLGVYLALGGGLVLTGIALRLLGIGRR